MILAFSHPGLVVPDLEKAVAFYRDMFGFRVIGEEGWEDNPDVDRAIGLQGKRSASRGAMMAGHNCFLELFEYSAPAQTASPPDRYLAHEIGIRHLAFYVDDVKGELERLIRLGGQVLGECETGATAVYARDPFGNIIELALIPGGEEEPTKLPGVDQLSSFEG
ncbi:MAG: VOC family protein [Chromatiales bacterium]|jgi:catechol 2,3-dioxygenase-like lactoylglutathione lyase family enzyme